MNGFFPTDPKQPHRLPAALDLGDWTEWQGVQILKGERSTTANVRFQMRYALNQAGDVGFALVPAMVDEVAVDFSVFPYGDNGVYVAKLTDGTVCRIPPL